MGAARRPPSDRDLSVRLASESLARIAEADATLHSFVWIDVRRVMAEARQRDRERTRGRLHGIPIAVKDIFDVAGAPTRANSRTTHDRPAKADALAVRRLREHGAVILGKVQTFELAIGIPSGDDLFPAAVNPHDRSRTPGGSSSGAAVAVAAGLCRGALASDTGGSIRGPAAYCGVVGLKPTRGVIPTEGMLSLAPSLDHAGLIAGSVGDLSSMWEPWTSAPPEPTDLRVIGVPDALIAASDVSAGVAGRFAEAVVAMRSLGWEIRAVAAPDPRRVEAIYRVILAREGFDQHRGVLSTDPAAFGINARARLREGAAIGDRVYRAALRDRDRIRAEYSGLLDQVDILAMPTTTGGAPPLDGVAPIGPSPFCIPFDLSGQPSLSLPCGRDPDGLDVGLLLSAASGDDDRLIAAAARLEVALGGPGAIAR